MKTELQEWLHRLVNDVFIITVEGLRERTLLPKFYPYVRWKVTEFEYSDAGIAKFSSRGENFLKPLWHEAVAAVENKVKKLSVYNDVVEIICKFYDLEQKRANQLLETLVSVIASDILIKEVKDPSELQDYVVRFLKDLNEEDQEYKAVVGIQGVVLRPDAIELDKNVLLRKTAVADLEREDMVGLPFHMGRVATPTAIMHLKTLARSSAKLQTEIGKAIAILGLFKVGAVRYTQYKMSSKSITDIMARGTLTSGKSAGAERCLITEQEVGQLKTFWSRMRNIPLPDSIYRPSPKEADHLSIAYQRYGDALDVGVLEKRMASTIMGLEALYLLPGELQELSYRLGLRVAKVLSFTGYDSSEVHANLSGAYPVRNVYVHGGLLSQTRKRKLEQRHGNLNQLLRQILDYLRASIVIFITSRPDKKSLIELIDNTFVNAVKDKDLRKIIISRKLK